MRVLTTIAVLLLSSSHVCSQTVLGLSVSGLIQLQPTSRTISAVGVGSDGETTYVEVEAFPTVVTVEPVTFSVSSTLTTEHQTVTLFSTPVTTTYTFVADASREHDNVPFLSGSIFETCSFGTDGRGACLETFPGVFTSQFSGSVIPIFTLAAASSTPTSPPQSTGTSTAPSSSSPASTSSTSNAGVSISPAIPWSVALCGIYVLLHAL